MKTRCNALIASLTVAVALALPEAGAQAERFGRDSVYAVPGKTVATQIVANADVTRYRRDSVYATQAPASGKTLVDTTAGSTTTRYGRDNVYAAQAPAAANTIGASTEGADLAFKPGRM
jgi:hypothetical protein